MSRSLDGPPVDGIDPAGPAGGSGRLLRDPQLRAGTVAVAAITTVAAAEGGLGGPAAAGFVAAIGLVWGVLLAFAGSRLARSEPRRRAWATVTLAGTLLTGGLLTGASIGAQLIMQAALDEKPQVFTDLVRGSIGTAQALPFYLLNTPMEWLLLPGVVLLTWRVPGQRRLAVAALLVFVAHRLWTYLYFVPPITEWSAGELGVPMSAGELDQARLWVRLSWIRMAADLVTITLILLALLIRPGAGTRTGAR